MTGRLALFVLAVAFAIAACQGGSSGAVPHNSPVAPLVYFQREPVQGWQAIDWNGAVHAVIGSDHVGIPYQSPDGSRVVWSSQGVWHIVDRSGMQLSKPDLSGRGLAWADDSSGVCVLKVVSESSAGGGTYRLVFDSATGGTRTITTLTTTKGPNVAACSPGAGRVVITTASGYKDHATMVMHITYSELSVIDFKTGAVSLHRAFPAGSASTEVSWVVVSHDGAYAALVTGNEASIVDLSTGQAEDQLTAITPLAFSWDGERLAAVSSSNRGEVLELSSNQVLWTDGLLGRVTQGAAANPSGADLRLFTTGGGLTDLVVVSSRGDARTIAAGVFPAQIAPCSSCSAF